MRSYICGYDRYDNVETGQSKSAICIMKKDRVIYCTQKMWKIKIVLWLMRLVGIRIIKKVCCDYCYPIAWNRYLLLKNKNKAMNFYKFLSLMIILFLMIIIIATIAIIITGNLLSNLVIIFISLIVLLICDKLIRKLKT